LLTDSAYNGSSLLDQNSGISGNTGFATIYAGGGIIVCSGGVGGLPRTLNMIAGAASFQLQFSACRQPFYAGGGFANGSMDIWVRNPNTGAVATLNGGPYGGGIQIFFQ